MDYSTILYDVDDGILTITLNRPEALNAFTNDMLMELIDACDRADADDNISAIIVTGAGRGFCAGADMDSLNTIDADERADKNAESPYKAFDNAWPLDFQRAQTWFPSVPKPIIAAINGPAAGLGLILSMWCDIRFASKSAVFSTAFSKRGLIAINPLLLNAVEKTADFEANLISHHIDRINPNPAAGPFIAAIIGFGTLGNQVCAL